ncbi:hypothetical protein [Microbacterium marinilacus]|uniref:Uncharacterized protein n=1 Tax=Microbacterium marinilacus TaxID=415209 RepID=A0ABP7BP98_9MICO|nr:hypothetical protein [Microbacterium marinilacus]MBY0688430.1 hypothetical protein [Microbacterium marinilacus]
MQTSPREHRWRWTFGILAGIILIASIVFAGLSAHPVVIVVLQHIATFAFIVALIPWPERRRSRDR